jgi:HAD superfamily hydrolase (TIGR01459 family)
MKHLSGIGVLADQYDGLILDLWGVVHDGVQPYPGARDCLLALRAAGKRVVLLSNAPRRAEPVRRQLRRMGIEDDLYNDVMTSGEASHLLLRDRPDAWTQALGRHVFHMGPGRDRNVLDGLDIEIVETPDRASFVLNTGPDEQADQTDPASFDDVLAQCAALGLRMICANPDLEVIRGGVRVVCAGTLAARYRDMRGEVLDVGKPDPLIYRPVLDMLGVPKARVLAVGDALRTDMAGARAVGVDACWVLGGLHGEHLGGDHAMVEAEAAAAGLAPVAAVPHFVWE